VIDNCAPYDLTIYRNDILDLETDNLIPIENLVISFLLSDMNNKVPKVSKIKIQKMTLKQNPI